MGVVIGAVLGASLNLTTWIFAVIAGMFLYIALAEMVSNNWNYFVRCPKLEIYDMLSKKRAEQRGSVELLIIRIDFYDFISPFTP